MATERLRVILEAVTDKYNKDFREAATTTGRLGAAAQDSGKKLSQMGSTLTSRVTLPLVALGGVAIKAASDLGESVNAVNVVFGDSAKIIHDWGGTAAESAGISQREFNQAATVLGSALKNAGVPLDEAADKTITLTQRAADMASVFNTSVPDALGAMQAALRGETDPIEKFGVSLNAAKVEAEALALGFKPIGGEFDNTAKAAARLKIIMDQTEQVAGDFANTSDGLANQSRILKARLEDTAAALGQELLPFATDAVGVLLALTEGFGKLSDEGKKTVLVLGGLAAAAGPMLLIFGKIATLIGAAPAAAIGLAAAAGAAELKLRSFGASFGGWIGAAADLGEAAGNLVLDMRDVGEVLADTGPIDAFTQNAFLMGEALGELPRGVSATRDSLRDDLIPAVQDARAEFDLDPTAGFAERLRDDLGPALDDTVSSALGVGSGLEALRDGAQTARSPVEKLAEALRDAADNYRSLASAVLEFVSPVMAAVGAMGRFTDAERAVDDLNRRGKRGTEEWATAMLELAVAKGEAQAALDSLDATGLENAISALATLLGGSREEAERLLDTLGLLDGTSVEVVLDIKVPRDIRELLKGLSGETITLGRPQVRQHGGPVSEGQPYIVGERGAEMFVPRQAGTIIPAGSWGGRSSTVNLTVVRPETSSLDRDLAYGALLAGLMSQVGA